LSSKKPPRNEPSTKPRTKAKRRRFPFRKVADLEADILDHETRLEQMHAELADGTTHRDGDRVRRLNSRITEQRESLQKLYEHWEEAIELNW
jgi:ATP-binding cassette subfamily F protein 3